MYDAKGAKRVCMRAAPGVYVPNMSTEDTYTWRAKQIAGKLPARRDPQERRGRSPQALVRRALHACLGDAGSEPDGSVNVSMKSTAE